MKRILSFCMFFIAISSTNAQAEKPANITAVTEFKQHYNKEDFQAIFMMFSDQMKQHLPLDKITTAMTNLQARAGNLNKTEFIEYEQGTVAFYKAEFERVVYGLYISLDGNDEINGLLFKPFIDKNTIPKMERNLTKLSLPFKGEWTVLWGGDTEELNYHVVSEAQKNAFDLLITNEKGLSFKTDGQTNQDYYVFGKELIAPADGEIILVVDGVKDNKPGTMNPVFVTGNTVIMKTANGEYILFAHFKQYSIKVKQGQKVKQGDLLGLCGNSGNSSEPHLHFHIQNIEDMVSATGVKCYFDKILVNGKLTTDYSPIKNDKIKNF